MTICCHSDIKYLTWRGTKGFLRVESIQILHNACSELLYGDGLEEQMCVALGVILVTCQMRLRSLRSCTEIIRENHASTSYRIYCTGRRTAIDWLLDWGMEGGRGDGGLLALRVLCPLGRSMTCVTLRERLVLCGVIWVADSWFKAYAMPLFRHWSSHGSLSWKKKKGRVSICSDPHLWPWGYHLLIHLFGRVACCLCWDVSRASASESSSQAVPRLSSQALQPPQRWGSHGAALPASQLVSDLLTRAGQTAESKQDPEQPLAEQGKSSGTSFWLPRTGARPLSPFGEEKGRWNWTGLTLARYRVVPGSDSLTLVPLSSTGEGCGAWTDCPVLLAEEQNLLLSRLLASKNS